MKMPHTCVGGAPSLEPSWWVNDAQNIPLVRVCDKCKAEKLARYRPEITKEYNQSDVDEPIEPE